MKKLIFTILVILLCGSMFVACGSSEGGEESVTDWEYIQGNEKIVIGYTDYAPMNYFENGELTGFDTEFALAVCEKLGIEPEFVEINWDTKVIELDAKSIDCIWNGMTIRPTLAENTSISVPYAKNSQVIIIKKDNEDIYKDTASLIDKTVVAEVGSAGEAQLSGEEAEENLAKAVLVGMAKQTDCLVEVKAGTAEAAVLDWTLAMAMVGEGTDYEDLMMIPNLELNLEEYGIAFRKGSDVTAMVNDIIDELVADGTLPALAEKYGLSLSDAISQ